jgi:DHA2 family multidrug resistance protein-like MFS transporter
MSLVAVLAMIFGLKQFAQNGVGWTPVVSIVAGLVIAVAFVRRQRHLDDPFIDLRLFRAPGFSPSLAAYGLGIVIVFGGFLFLPQYLQLVLGLSPLEAGLWTLPWAVGFVVGSQLTPGLARRIPPATLMAGGMVLAAIGFAVFVGLDERSGFWPFLTGSVIFSLGMAPVFTLAIDLIVGVAPPERAGAASAIAETAAEFGGAMGIAIFGSIGVAIYRSGIAEGLPEGVPAEAAAVARDTLGGAVEIARQLPDRLGAPLLDAARDAFIQGIHVSALISVVGAIGLAVFIGVLLRRKGVGAETMAEETNENEETEPGEAA